MVFPVIMYGCESWTIKKNWCFPTVVLEKTLESPLDCKEIKPINSKGNQPWILIGGTDAETEAPILCPPDVKNWLIWKDPEVGKDWRWEKGTTEDEMVGWHHQLDGHEFEQAPGVGDGQGSLACCTPWGRKESGTTEQLNWTEPSGFSPLQPHGTVERKWAWHSVDASSAHRACDPKTSFKRSIIIMLRK